MRKNYKHKHDGWDTITYMMKNGKNSNFKRFFLKILYNKFKMVTRCCLGHIIYNTAFVILAFS